MIKFVLYTWMIFANPRLRVDGGTYTCTSIALTNKSCAQLRPAKGDFFIVQTWISSLLFSLILLVHAASYAEPYQSFNFTVREPWFSDIKNGTKDVEGRLDRGVFSQIKAGDRILWNSNCLVRVTFVDHYTSIVQMLVMEGLKHVLPGVTSFEKAVAIYEGFYPGQTNNTAAIGIGMALIQSGNQQ